MNTRKPLYIIRNAIQTLKNKSENRNKTKRWAAKPPDWVGWHQPDRAVNFSKLLPSRSRSGDVLPVIVCDGRPIGSGGPAKPISDDFQGTKHLTIWVYCFSIRGFGGTSVALGSQDLSSSFPCRYCTRIFLSSSRCSFACRPLCAECPFLPA